MTEISFARRVRITLACTTLVAVACACSGGGSGSVAVPGTAAAPNAPSLDGRTRAVAAARSITLAQAVVPLTEVRSATRSSADISLETLRARSSADRRAESLRHTASIGPNPPGGALVAELVHTGNLHDPETIIHNGTDI